MVVKLSLDQVSALIESARAMGRVNTRKVDRCRNELRSRNDCTDEELENSIKIIKYIQMKDTVENWTGEAGPLLQNNIFRLDNLETFLEEKKILI